MFDTIQAQRVLAEHIAWARLLLNLRDGAGEVPAQGVQVPDASASPLNWLVARLELSSAASQALWLLTACEIDDELAAVARARSQMESTAFTVASLKRILLGVACVVSTEDIEKLAALGLIELECDHRVAQTRRWLRASDRVIELATGGLRLDPFVAAIASITTQAMEIVVPASVRAALSANAVIIATGPEGSGRRTMLAAAAVSLCAGALTVDCRGLATSPDVLVRQLRAIVRECCLFGVVPLFAELQMVDAANWSTVEQEVFDAFEGPVLATMESSRSIRTRRSLIEVELAQPTLAERQRIWQRAIPELDHDVLARASSYFIAPGIITKCAQAARAAAGAHPVSDSHVRDSLRTVYDQKLSALAKRIEVTQTWDDLVLPADQFEEVVELVARVRHRGLVLDTWGFADKVGKGNGVAAMFSGPPGTGKTMAAGLIAKELALDLYQVDLSKVVSKYIGETEKALGALFDAAESGHAVLLFDEADSLFAKRSEVKSSNDRYANLEVNYLLQRLEAFKGICILTTNHEAAIDDAFRRRLAIHVRFPVPEEEQREQLWKAMLPDRASVQGQPCFAKLAREFAMTGGYIKNAVVRAAYLAADEGEPISIAHFHRAARAEYEAAGKIACATL